MSKILSTVKSYLTTRLLTKQNAILFLINLLLFFFLRDVCGITFLTLMPWIVGTAIAALLTA
jgi:hypothetical protein